MYWQKSEYYVAISISSHSTFLLELLESMNSSESPSLQTETEKLIVKQGDVKMSLTYPNNLFFNQFLRLLLYYYLQKHQLQHKSQ